MPAKDNELRKSYVIPSKGCVNLLPLIVYSLPPLQICYADLKKKAEEHNAFVDSLHHPAENIKLLLL